VFELKHNKAAGPDGFPSKCYQTFLEYIQEDLKEMLDKFHCGHLGIGSLNHGVITPIPKVPDAMAI
jgi:hypothetical protein